MNTPIFQQISEALQYSFILRALIAGCLIAVCCSCLGIFLVLRRFSLIGDGLAHVSFATIALGLLLKSRPLFISIPLVAAASLLILKLSEKENIYSDAAIGLVSAFSISLGVLLASVAGGFNVDLFSYLFGNILVISRAEVILTAVLSLFIIATVTLFYQDLFSVTFDEEYAKVSGVKTSRVNKILILLTSITVVLGIKVVGTMLVSSLIILPSVTGLQLAKGFRTAIICALFSAVLSVISGIFISYIFDLPSGATIVQINFLFFIIAFICRKLRR